MSRDLAHYFRQTIQEVAPEVFQGEAFVVGVSGGPDSMALLGLLQEVGLSPFVIHLNYQLRGEDSDKDQKLVESMCGIWGLECASFKVDPKPLLEGSGNLQNWAREERYSTFREVAEAEGIKLIFTAHHQDDQLETILQRVLRGAGLAQWKGISMRSDDLVRPLLNVSKQDLMGYVQHRGIPYRIDISNEEAGYARNMLRHSWFPGMDDFFPGWKSNLLALRDRAYEVESLTDVVLNSVIQTVDSDAKGGTGASRADVSEFGPEISRAGTPKSGAVTRRVDTPHSIAAEPSALHRSSLLNLPKNIQGVVLLRWIELADPDVRRGLRRATLETIQSTLEHLQTGKSFELSESATLLRDRDRFRLLIHPSDQLKARQAREVPGTPVSSHTSADFTAVVSLKLSEVKTVTPRFGPPIKLSLERVSDPELVRKAISTESELWIGVDFDASGIENLELTIRVWQPGDRFTPLGMPGKSQRISDHLTNRSLSGPERTNALVIQNQDRILGVLYGPNGALGRIGMPSDEAKCTSASKTLLRIRYAEA